MTLWASKKQTKDPILRLYLHTSMFLIIKAYTFQGISNLAVAQTVKNLLAMQETRVWSLGQEDPLEKGMATHSSILAWGIPWTKEPGGL